MNRSHREALRAIRLFCIVLPLATAGSTLAAPIPVDVTITASITYDTASSFSSPDAAHGGGNRLVAGGSSTAATFSDGSVTGGPNPLLGTFTDTGDGVGITGAVGGTVGSGEYLAGVDFSISLTNSSFADTYEVVLGVSYSHSTDADGDNAFASSELAIHEGATALFSSHTISDVAVADTLNGTILGTSGALVSDSGFTALILTLSPGETMLLSGAWSGEGRGLAVPDATASSLDAFVFINEVNSVAAVPEPGTGSLLMTGLLALAGRRKRSA